MLGTHGTSKTDERERQNKMEKYTLDLSRLTEEQKGDLSQHLHNMQETCIPLQGDGTRGIVYGSILCAEGLKESGFDVDVVDIDGWGSSTIGSILPRLNVKC
jgi:hypothetical protein